MKRLLINWLLPVVIDKAIEALQSLARKSSNNIDDQMVQTISTNRDSLIEEIKASL